MRRTPLKRTPLKRRSCLTTRSTLKQLGRRGRRLAGEDRKARARAKREFCLCGCRRHGHQVDWSHLDGRSELARHDDVLSVAACRRFHDWLDQTASGVQCRRDLRELARTAGRRLTSTDAASVLQLYNWTPLP